MRRYPAYTLDVVRAADAHALFIHLALLKEEENDGGEQRPDQGER